MNKGFVEFFLAFGAIAAAVAVCAVCVIGLVVWLAGRDRREE